MPPPDYTDLEPSSDTLIDAPEAPRQEAAPSRASVSIMPMRSSGYAAPSKRQLPDLTVENAYKTLQFFQDNPRYLASPYTRNAAESVFGAASKVIGMNIQIERLNSKAEAARAQSSTAGMVGKSLLKLAEGGGEGAKWASQWYAPGNDGKAKYEDPSNWASILDGYETRSTAGKDSGDLVGIEIAMPDGSTVQAIRNTEGKGYTVVPKKSEAESAIATKETAKKISRLETDARELEKKYIAANAEYVESMSGRKIEGQSNKAIKDKADYFRAQQMKKVQEIEALRQPVAATNSPAPSAIPMPSVKTELKPGTRYTTPRGEATWDGEKFVK